MEITLWLVAITYWENGESPIECRLIEKPYDNSSLYRYVFHTGYGHTCYVPAERCFESREAAIKAAHLLTQLKDLRNEADFEYQFCLRSDTLPPIKKQTGRPRAGYILRPAHKVKNGPNVGYTGDGNNSSCIYWDSYSAQKEAEKMQQKQKTTVVEIMVTPMQIVQ